MKIENPFLQLCLILHADSKYVLVSLQELITFDFYSFEIKKKKAPENMKIIIFSKYILKIYKMSYFQFYICCANFIRISP